MDETNAEEDLIDDEGDAEGVPSQEKEKEKVRGKVRPSKPLDAAEEASDAGRGGGGRVRKAANDGSVVPPDLSTSIGKADSAASEQPKISEWL